MNVHHPQPHESAPSPCRRHHEDAPELVLSELNPLVVLDHLDGEQSAVALLTFGSVREPCPKCRQCTLKLVLRQNAVRMAHLFCAECESCFDARYADGAPALTI